MIYLSPRMTRIAVLTLAMFLLVSLPTFRADRNDRNLGNALTPSVACAGGSPDETLKPVDPQKSGTIAIGVSTENARTSTTVAANSKLMAFERWQLFVSVFRTFASRF